MGKRMGRARGVAAPGNALGGVDSCQGCRPQVARGEVEGRWEVPCEDLGKVGSWVRAREGSVARNGECESVSGALLPRRAMLRPDLRLI